MAKTIRILDEALEAGLSLGLPGLSLAISSPSAGNVEVTAGDGIDDSSVFCIGSITKTFVAVVILQLAEEGCLDLDKSTKDYIDSDSDLRMLLNRVPNATTATVRHMLSHQSGIPTWEFVPQWIHDARGDNLDPQKLWSSIAALLYVVRDDDNGGSDVPVPPPPGEHYSYSNTNYTVLGHIVEAVTDNTIAHEIRQRILVPLGLSSAYLYGFEAAPTNSQFPPRLYHYVTPAFQRDAGVSDYFDDTVNSNNRTSPHSIMETTRATNLSCEWAAGGLCMTMKDLRTMGLALSSVLQGGDDSSSLLLRNNIMFQYQPPRSDRIDFDGLGLSNSKSLSATGEEYCLGICHSVGKTDIWHHGGLTLSFSSRLLMLPCCSDDDGRRTVVTCATNIGLMHSGFDEGSSPWDEFVDGILIPAVKRFVVDYDG